MLHVPRLCASFLLLCLMWMEVLCVVYGAEGAALATKALMNYFLFFP